MTNLSNFISIPLKNRIRTEWHQINLNLKIISAKISRQFYRPPYPKSDSGKVNLHLGCGTIDHPDFINIDGMPFSHVHYVRDIDDLSPFRDETIDLIYACHCLEHFPHQDIPLILSSWFKKLKPGGTLRLSVPDFDKLINIYLENNRDVDTILQPVMGGQNNSLDFHKVAFNHKSLAQLLVNAGFKEVSEWDSHSCNLGNFDDWSSSQFFINEKYYPVSLNIEAVK